jgi:hypothetical protein
MKAIGYVAVRAADSELQWFAMSTFSTSEEYARELAGREDTKLPEWAESNPVVRVAKVEVTEV